MWDSDGDGIEDKTEVIWDKPTFRTPMQFGWAPGNPYDLYVVSNGKVSVLRDDNHDHRPDREEVFNTGWPPDAGFTGGGVDAVGMAFDPQGSLYIGLGCMLFANPYLVDDKTGVSRYDVHSERGTILKISPDGKKREIVCTGIRFPIGIAFNRHGDLFCTDQEGATWLEGGNPLDELNQILPGKHYGFPFKHEKYLPNVTDEPPVLGFGPQHQCACGLIFNEASPAREKTFGPAWWENDAIVAGYSRGKLWHVPLAKTDAGYVGRIHQFAALRLLTLDTAIDPRGNLTVACHSGEPDWGTGPGGEGRLFKISYTDREVAQPVLAWAAGPMEVRVAFDRPVDQALLSDVMRDPTKATITYGEFVRAGDRYEVLKPPYEVVAQQSRAFRGELPVTSAKLTDDRRMLVLTTDPHPMQAWYAVHVPLAGPTLADGQERAVELDYNLTGVEAAWSDEADGKPAWAGWLPHPDLAVSRVLTAGSAEHEKLFALVSSNKGHLVITPGREEANPVPAYRSERTVARYPAWVPRQLPAPPPPKSVASEGLAGGDWKRGEALFYSAEANCATCHVVRGKGGHIGPDLSNLPQRDAAGIYRDITEPNAVINPDHRGYTVVLRNKTVLAGLVRSDSADRLRIYDTAGKETVVARSDVEQLRADSISIMPEGFAKLGPEKLRDLIMFLSFAEPPPKELLSGWKPRESGENREPPPRTRAEVEAVLGKGGPKVDVQKLRSLRVLLVAGPKDHGPLEHDYPAWQKAWEPLISKAPKVNVATAFGKPEARQWESSDLVVFYNWGPQFWDDATYANLDKYLARRGGLAVLHSGVIPEKEPQKLADHIGLAYPTMIKFRHGPLDLRFTDAAQKHPATRGFPPTLHLVDESYWPPVGDASKAGVLATQDEEGQPRPMVWAVERGKGKVFSTILGHYTWTFEDPLARALILRGMAWAAGEDEAGIHRFDNLVLDGVRLRDGGAAAAASAAGGQGGNQVSNQAVNQAGGSK
jgi:putative heme-binding domain-containing protein